MVFLVVDTNNYDLLLGLDFLMKIGAVVDVDTHVPGCLCDSKEKAHGISYSD
jgi:hypothetical protein